MGASKIRPTATLLTLRSEIRYTCSMCKANESTADLVPQIGAWTTRLEPLEAEERAIEETAADFDATRMTVNRNLDKSVKVFSREEEFALGGDRDSAQWKQYFGKYTPSQVLRLAFAMELSLIEGWLTVQGDPALDKCKPELDKWCRAGRNALANDAALSQRRAVFRTTRDDYCKWLTSQRDALWRELASRGEALKEERDFADAFFRKPSRSSTSAEASVPPEDSAPPAP